MNDREVAKRATVGTVRTDQRRARVGARHVSRCVSCRYPRQEPRRGLCAECAQALFRLPAGVPIL